MFVDIYKNRIHVRPKLETELQKRDHNKHIRNSMKTSAVKQSRKAIFFSGFTTDRSTGLF